MEPDAPHSQLDCERWVCVRLHNSTEVELDEVRLEVDVLPITFRNVPPDDFTDYVPVRQAYSVAAVNARVGDKEYSHQLSDHVGADRVERGRVTYDVFLQDGRLALRFQRDD